MSKKTNLIMDMGDIDPLLKLFSSEIRNNNYNKSTYNRFRDSTWMIQVKAYNLFIDMLSGFGDKLDVLKYMTLFSVLDVQKIFADHAYAWWSSLIMLTVAGLLVIVSIRVFDKRSLNI